MEFSATVLWMKLTIKALLISLQFRNSLFWSMASLALKLFNDKDLKKELVLRKGEHRLGQRVKLIEGGLDELPKLAKKGVRFAILGIPECIGPLGNNGRKGAENGFSSFLRYFLNTQSNRFLDGSDIVLVGEVDLADLQLKANELDPASDYFHQKLHLMCETVDERVEPIVKKIAGSGLVPILIGGGHNNAYPIISATASAHGPLNVLNIDAHADFRALEGRHSGNGFSYAFQKKYLNKYAVLGLHQNYNSENMLKSMDATGQVKYIFFEDIQYADKLLLEAIEFVKSDESVAGLELDLDAIRYMPSSALSPSGFSLDQMRYFVRKSAKALSPSYLHLAEGAPRNDQEELVVGKALSYLVTDFIKNR